MVDNKHGIKPAFNKGGAHCHSRDASFYNNNPTAEIKKGLTCCVLCAPPPKTLKEDSTLISLVHHHCLIVIIMYPSCTMVTMWSLTCSCWAPHTFTAYIYDADPPTGEREKGEKLTLLQVFSNLGNLVLKRFSQDHLVTG